MGLQIGVGELGLVAGEGQEGELAQLELLGRVEGRKTRRLLLVGGVEAVGEELEVGVMRSELGILGQGSDGRGVKELGKNEGVRGRSGTLDKVGGSAGGGG